MHKVLVTEWDRIKAEANIIIEDKKLHKKKRVVKFETFDRFC